MEQLQSIKAVEFEDKLRKIKMDKNDTIPVYLTKFVHCMDELRSVGVSVDEEGQFKKVGIRAKNLYRLEVDGMSTELPTVGKCKKYMKMMFEREKVLHAGNSEPRDVEQPQDEDHVVGATTHAKKFRAKWQEGVQCSYTTR